MLFERFYDAGAGAYDRVFGRVPRDFAPALLRMARLTSGVRVLDIATGTAIVAEVIATAVGPSGHVVAADIPLPMLDGAKRRLGGVPNVSFGDGQALSLPDGHFDAVVCSLGLMLFPSPARGLAEFHRVLRPGGRAAVSVETTPEQSFTTRRAARVGRRRGDGRLDRGTGRNPVRLRAQVAARAQEGACDVRPEHVRRRLPLRRGPL